jgi:hypothetical protein
MSGWIRLGAAIVIVPLVLLAAALLLTFGRPPQPLPFGTVAWMGEAGVTVDGVDRRPSISFRNRRIVAAGEFYIVHARVLAPFGLRPVWHDADATVKTFAGSGGTPAMRHLTFGIDERAQALLDTRTGRPGPNHLIRGAEEHEDVVFDLPRDVEQPGFVVAPANDPAGVLNWLFGRFWQPHRFNLRYD